MRYEPVNYVIEYEIGALLIFLIIAARYFHARRFPNQKNRLFSLILWITIGDILLDVASSLAIDNVFTLPAAVTHVVCFSFYSVSTLMLVLMMVYTLALSDFIDPPRLRRLFPLFLPGVLVQLMLLSNPFTKWFFYIDPLQGYIHGSAFFAVYLSCLIYLIFTFSIAVINRSRLSRIEFSTIVIFLILVLAATAIQYIRPDVLATGVAIAAAVVLMYFTIQNPDAMVDTTTGAFTYDAMLVFLNDQMQENVRVQLLGLKVDNMSRINELLGIENGSLMLRQVCQFLGGGAEDVWVFRMRGSCFVAITRNHGESEALCHRLNERVSQPWVVRQTEVMLKATICRMATDELMDRPISAEEAVNYLETAFHQEYKGGGSIRTIIAGHELLEKVSRNKAVEAALREAIRTGDGLELYFQPIWSVKRSRFVSAEVLLRFFHPVMGFISPEEFVRVAESEGLVTAMDEVVVRKACAFLQSNGHCRHLGLEGLEINLSALEFMHFRLPELLNSIMTEYGVDPSFLCFEITETAATESFELLKDSMVNLGKIGCRFALDDFGTGYANISQVIQLPFSMVKLDKSLLYGPPAVLRDMAHMFSGMDRTVVVEGVETQAQAAAIGSFSVDLIQGFYYSTPMNQTAFLRFLKEKNGFADS